jgi:hypothetical protein
MPNLTIISAGTNDFSSVDFSNTPNLTSIDLSRSSNLETVDLTGLTDLVSFNCSSCDLSAIDVSQNSLLERLQLGVYGYLGCPEDNYMGFCTNHIENIDLSNNNNLLYLNLEGNPISSLAISNLVNLTGLQLQGMEDLTTLDLSANINLESLVIGGTSITTIDLSGLNSLRSLNVTNSDLISVDISSNLYLATFIAARMSHLSCITVDSYHIANQLYDNTINGSSVFEGTQVYFMIDESISISTSLSSTVTIGSLSQTVTESTSIATTTVAFTLSCSETIAMTAYGLPPGIQTQVGSNSITLFGTPSELATGLFNFSLVASSTSASTSYTVTGTIEVIEEPNVPTQVRPHLLPSIFISPLIEDNVGETFIGPFNASTSPTLKEGQKYYNIKHQQDEED